MSSGKLTLRQIYKDFKLRYDVREARKFLELNKSTPKTEVNKVLRNYYHSIIEDTHQPIYTYTLTGKRYKFGTSQGEKTQITPVSFTFQSKTEYKIYPMNIVLQDKTDNKQINALKDKFFNNGFPTFFGGDIPEIFEAFLIPFIKANTAGPAHYFNFTIEKVSKRKLPKTKKQLKDMPLYYCSVNVPQRQFNGFKDSGNMMCVPETILHHLKMKGRNKKLKLDDVIKQLEIPYEATEEGSNDIEEENLYKVICERCGKYIGKCFFEKKVTCLNCQNNSGIDVEKEEGDYAKKDDIHHFAGNVSKDNEWYVYDEEEGEVEDPDEEGEVEDPDEEYGKRGYTPDDIVRVLKHYKCKARLVDINENMFLCNSVTTEEADKHLLSFCGMVYDNHLYYCNEQSFVKSLSEKTKAKDTSKCFQSNVYEKDVKYKDEKTYEIVEAVDLLDYYRQNFKNDNTIRVIKTENGRITSILYDDDVIVCANPEKSIMKKIMGNDFKNENTNILAEKEFKEFFPSHKPSAFTKEVFDQLHKHGNIVECFNEPKEEFQHEYDINKCRTDCWMNNKLGPYEVFGPSAQIEEYKGVLKNGLYYVELSSNKDREFFMRGNTWYSKQFIEFGLKEGYEVNIKYQLLATSYLKANYFKPFVSYIIEKYPDHFKHIINNCIGYRGKTQSKKSKGYMETDFDLAVAAFWDNNDDQIGFIDEKNIDRKKWNLLKGKMCNIHNVEIDEHTTHYVVEFKEFKTLYENDLPIFNKVLENEFLRVYNLKKSLGGRLIKIKTDAVVVEGKHNKITLSKNIGGIKYEKITGIQVKIHDKSVNFPTYTIDTSMNWNVVYEKEGEEFPQYSGSYLVTGLAGFGKSYIVKQQAEYDEGTTLRLAFTNVAKENICDETHPANTLNSCFGINCLTGKCSEKRLNNLRNIKTIIITEVFMIPSYIMGYLSKIKHEFPNIKFICEGDPKQTRPVGEEHINWLDTKLLHTLCDGNMIQLTINKRNDETKNYERIFEGKELDGNKYSNREPQEINICRTNAMRVTINHDMMNKADYFIPKNKKNDKSQDMWINTDTPMMCIKNDKKLKLVNGKMYKLEKIEKDNIEIGGTCFKKDDLISEYFVVAHAVTNHKIQGLTIKCKFNIYEWNKMDIREKYTAYSRTSDGDNVKINIEKEVDYKLWEELQEFFKINYCVYKWVCSKCNDIYVGHTNNFEKRKKEHIKASENDENKLYKKMRETGLEFWTMEILEQFYAPNRVEAEKVEQKWIMELQANLNMCNAHKI